MSMSTRIMGNVIATHTSIIMIMSMRNVIAILTGTPTDTTNAPAVAAAVTITGTVISP